jgi:hypothetical protein
MIKEKFSESNYYKIALSILVVVSIIFIWHNGYEFGKWLHTILN